MFEKIKEILKGIDETETCTEHGWWETSTGADFGARKLDEIKLLFEDACKPIDGHTDKVVIIQDGFIHRMSVGVTQGGADQIK